MPTENKSTLRERPILFSGPMVRAILEGRKTVTRRAVSIQPNSRADIGSYGVGQPFIRNPNSAKKNLECPYGRPGDRLWVRETWQGPLVSSEEMEAAPSWHKDLKRYRDAAHCAYRASGDSCEYVDPDDNFHCRWRPSIHMPRWASRILLEVTDVRVERLQDISEEQAIAEGVRQMLDGSGTWVGREGPESMVTPWLTAKEAFADLWESINGPESWGANSWIWCVEFPRVTP